MIFSSNQQQKNRLNFQFANKCLFAKDGWQLDVKSSMQIEIGAWICELKHKGK